MNRELPSICTIMEQKKKVVFCIPLNKGQTPHPKTVDSLRASIPLVHAAGFEEGMTFTAGNPYISGARADMTRRALSAKATHIFYIDYDVAWRPEDLVKVLTAPGEVVAGTYRCKTDDPEEIVYMGAVFTDEQHRPITRDDGCIKAKAVPAGFLRITNAGLDRFMREYPDLCYGPQYDLSVDLFNHGAHKGIWWGEDYAFSRNFIDKCGDIWIVPDLDLDHHSHWNEGLVYKGNFHKYLLAQPGGSEYEETDNLPVAVGV